MATADLSAADLPPGSLPERTVVNSGLSHNLPRIKTIACAHDGNAGEVTANEAEPRSKRTQAKSAMEIASMPGPVVGPPLGEGDATERDLYESQWR